MKATVAVLMGLVSGLIIYFAAAMIFADLGSGSTGPSGLFVAMTLIGGWALTTWLLLRKVGSTNMVLRRGFLVGAAEWLFMAFAGVIFSGRSVSNSLSDPIAANSGAAQAGAAVGGGIVAAITGGVSVFMAVVCLIGFAIAYFMAREMHDSTTAPKRKCPECAEMIQAEARKCKHCGATLRTELSTA